VTASAVAIWPQAWVWRQTTWLHTQCYSLGTRDLNCHSSSSTTPAKLKLHTTQPCCQLCALSQTQPAVITQVTFNLRKQALQGMQWQPTVALGFGTFEAN
jgi:hypothetical protein